MLYIMPAYVKPVFVSVDEPSCHAYRVIFCSDCNTTTVTFAGTKYYAFDAMYIIVLFLDLTVNVYTQNILIDNLMTG